MGIERGLIGPKEGERIWERHILNCIPITTLLPNPGAGVTIADVGSGAGLPGIVIALARPEMKVTLIEPLQRRVDFLNEVVGELELPIKVIRGKAEAVKASFDFVTARAVAPLPRLIASTWHLIKPGGALLAMKGESASAEIEAANSENERKGKMKITLHEINLDDLPLARAVEVAKAG